MRVVPAVFEGFQIFQRILTTAVPGPAEAETPGQPKKLLSNPKIEANRQNAQHSTGPKTPGGIAKSAQNAVSHGIFAKKFLNGAAPEIVEEMTKVEAGLRECYQPVGMIEEILLQKILVESARYGRILGFEQREITREAAFFNPAVDRVDRYATSASRALFRAIEELERIQAARKASESSAASPDTESPEQ